MELVCVCNVCMWLCLFQYSCVGSTVRELRETWSLYVCVTCVCGCVCFSIVVSAVQCVN